MKARRLFPLGKAYGKAFCNRVEETKRLIGNIESGKHTFLVAPRRYGKSSLCEHAFSQLKLPWEKLDFHLAITEKDAEQIILNGVTELVGKSVGAINKLQNIIKKYVKRLKPIATLGTEHMKLQFELTSNVNPAESIAEALFLLEKLLQEKNVQAVLLFDEFQEVGNMERGRGIEGAVRHVAQETQNLSFIFSGSNPQMLEAMFEDERRPLYKLCRKLVLDRISEADYFPHIHKAAKLRWGKPLPQDSFDYIMQLTERHPYYVNYICDELWSDNEVPPTKKAIDKAWEMVLEEERSDLIKDFFSLSENQRKLMVYMANFGGHTLYGSKISQETNIPGGSLVRTVSSLVEKNYIEKTSDGYRIIVPLYKNLLSTHQPL